MKDKTYTILNQLNSPQTGSIGEYVFHKVILKNGFEIETVHKNQTDFIVEYNLRVDVKTQRKLDENYSKPPKYYGKKVDNVEYALVVFYNDIVFISLKQSVFTYNYSIIEKWIIEWSTKNKKKSFKINKFDKVKEYLINQMKNREIRIIYRTNQIDFGNESPHNLIPTQIKEGRWTIFISYEYEISENKLVEIIAFRDEETCFFPKLSKSRFHEEKVDLEKLNKRYKFKTFDKLIKYINNSN